MNPTKQRVSEYCNYKNIAISFLEKKAGLSNGYFNSIRKRPSLEKLDKISSAFPDLNREWLLTGHGSMLNGNVISSHNVSGGDMSIGAVSLAPSPDLLKLQEEVAALKATVAAKDETIAILRDLLGKR